MKKILIQHLIRLELYKSSYTGYSYTVFLKKWYQDNPSLNPFVIGASRVTSPQIPDTLKLF